MTTGQVRVIAILVYLLLMTSVGVGWCASQSDVAAFFEGKRMTFIVANPTGGGYDTQARLLAPFLEKYLKVKTAIKNIAGGSGIIGHNELYRSEPDGLTIGYLSVSAMITPEVGNAPGVAFETLKFSWIAQAVGESTLFLGSNKLPAFQEVVAKRTPLIFGASNDAMAVAGEAGAKLFSLPWKIVKGFEGTPQINASIIRGEIQLTQVYASAAHPVIKAGDLKGLVVLDDKPWDEYPEMPTLLKVGPSFTRDQLSMAKALIGLFNVARGIAGPPGIPQERLSFIRAKVNDAFKDEAFVKQFEKTTGQKSARLPLDQYLNLLNDALNAPPELRAIIKPYFAK